MTPWFQNVTPHKDIQEGHLDESLFAANLAEVASGTGREIYTNPALFFRKTYFTAGLKNIARRVIRGLNGGEDAENRVVSLQTGFGGGKTHTLISLYHLAKWGRKATESKDTAELIQATGEPDFDTANIAVFTNTTNDPAQGRTVDGVHLRTLWGELAYQLGGREVYELIRINDEQRIAPKGLFKQVLERCKPALILIDELADYCVSASGVKVEASNLSDQTISFLQELTEAVSGTDNCVLIATLPASAQELAASPASTNILTALESRIIRIGANTKPVEDDEIFEVVRRRLFEDLGSEAIIEEVVSAYAYMYQSLLSEVPDYAVKSDYRKTLGKSYPFHPELINMFRLRWASHPHFQRTRGVLRLLAAIVSDLWKRRTSLSGDTALIHTSDVQLTNLDALTSQITQLHGYGWDSVINADVSGTSSNACRIDNEVKALGVYGITQGVAVSILLGTFGSQGQNKGISLAELKLCMIRPQGFNHNDVNAALDKLEDHAHYLYHSTAGQKRYWFHTKPNINILINQTKSSIDNPTIDAEILKRITEKTRHIQLFTALVHPSGDVPEQHRPTLVILSPAHFATPGAERGNTTSFITRLSTRKGNSDRVYRNTVLFLLCSEIGINKLRSDAQDYLACTKISEEYAGQLEKEQKEEIRKRCDEAFKQLDISIAMAYSIVAKFSSKQGIETIVLNQFRENIEAQINDVLIRTLKDEEWLLERIGLNTLRNNNLLPSADHPVNVKDMYEAFLRFDDKPMITGPEALQTSLLRYCTNGEICIATGNGVTFTEYYYREDVPHFDVEDTTYWLVEPESRPQEKEPQTLVTSEPIGTGGTVREQDSPYAPSQPIEYGGRQFHSITVSGKVALDRYSELFGYFIRPFAMHGNGSNIEIEVRFTIKPTSNVPLSDTNQQYKNAKEAAKQLGLDFEEKE